MSESLLVLFFHAAYFSRLLVHDLWQLQLITHVTLAFDHFHIGGGAIEHSEVALYSLGPAVFVLILQNIVLRTYYLLGRAQVWKRWLLHLLSLVHLSLHLAYVCCTNGDPCLVHGLQDFLLICLDGRQPFARSCFPNRQDVINCVFPALILTYESIANWRILKCVHVIRVVLKF